MSLMSSALGTHRHASEAESHRARGNARALPHREAGLEPHDTWRHRSPSLAGGGPGATGHMAMPEPSCTGRRVWSRGTRGNTGALPHRVAGPVPRGTWRRQSPPASGGRSGVTGHVATPEPFPIRRRARCHRARGDARAFRHRERVWSRGDTWRYQSPSLSGVESNAVELDLSLVHRGTRSAGYRQRAVKYFIK
jgi:hypothetical protein